MDTQSTEPIRFRPTKKRKTYRQRPDDNDDDNDTPDANTTTARPETTEHHRAKASDFFQEDEQEETEVPPTIAAARLRNTRRTRLQGVGFRTNNSSQPNPSTSQALVHRTAAADGQGPAASGGIVGHFTHQTGLINDINERHMNEYIESRLSSRSRTQHDNATAPRPCDADTIQLPAATARIQPAMQGKLIEVDIAAVQQANTTVAPNQRPERMVVLQMEEPKQPRLGPDGKPWRSRNRRNSDDIRRDQLVDQFLSENRLDVYDQPAAGPSAPENDGDADNRVAEEFKRQFFDDQARRRLQHKKRKAINNTTKPKPRNEDVLRGPRLGGSRNSRAAVRNALIQKEKEAKQK